MCPFCVPPLVRPQICLLSGSILYEVCTVRGSTIEVSAQKQVSERSYLLTGLPHFQKPFRYHSLLLASYHYFLLLAVAFALDSQPVTVRAALDLSGWPF
jgi:hypothetical protein